MSDKPNLEKTAGTPLVEEQAATQQPNFSQPIIIERKHSTGKGIATGALALSVLALGASGLLFVQGQNTFKIQEEKVHQELEKAALGESENARKLTASLDEQGKLNAIVAQLDTNQQKNFKHLAEIQRAYQELLKGRVNWLVDEIEVTLNLASQQLLLSGNVPVAITVLESIEQRLSRFEQSELLPIKKAISHDLDMLKQNAGSYMDIAGTALKLDNLEKAVAGLPLVIDSTLQPKEVKTEEVAESADFWTRAWNKTVHMLQSMVEIRKLDSTDAMLLAPEQIYFVRANLRLRLLDARLALLQHNSEVYKNNLAVIESTVKQYFDVKSPTTQKWLEELGKLNNQNLSIVSDDVLKESQAAVRDYQNKTRTALPVNLTPVEELSAITLPTSTGAAAVKEESVQATSSVAASAPAKAEEAKPAAKQPEQQEAKPEENKASGEKADAAGKSETGKSVGAAAAVLAPMAALAAAQSQAASAVKSEPVSSNPPAAREPVKKAEEPKKAANRTENRAAVKHNRTAKTERNRAERRREAAKNEQRKSRKPKARREAAGGGEADAANP